MRAGGGICVNEKFLIKKTRRDVEFYSFFLGREKTMRNGVVERVFWMSEVNGLGEGRCRNGGILFISESI